MNRPGPCRPPAPLHRASPLPSTRPQALTTHSWALRNNIPKRKGWQPEKAELILSITQLPIKFWPNPPKGLVTTTPAGHPLFLALSTQPSCLEPQPPETQPPTQVSTSKTTRAEEQRGKREKRRGCLLVRLFQRSILLAWGPACAVGLGPRTRVRGTMVSRRRRLPGQAQWLLFTSHMGSLSSESWSLLFLFICLALCCFINQNLKRRISLLCCHLAED